MALVRNPFSRRLIYSFIDVKGFRSNKSTGFNGPFNAIFHGQASKLLVQPNEKNLNCLKRTPCIKIKTKLKTIAGYPSCGVPMDS